MQVSELHDYISQQNEEQLLLSADLAVLSSHEQVLNLFNYQMRLIIINLSSSSTLFSSVP